ncbi:hypothetical protein [Streptomyces triticisoli]|uniref:hypothetical protein n=1 Tax=Streptomyces triticisoli TaxID=2182797 RepID=UPI000DDB8E4E|nr:hypothetical protein [Streptomyces triticisoli]
MAERLTFTLTGRDELSRVLNGTADSADRLRLRLSGISADADGQLRDLRGRFLSADEAARRLGDSTHGTRDSLANLRDEAGKLGESLKANLISLAPAAIPIAAGLAGSAAAVAAQFGAVAVAAGAYGLALAPQIGAIGEAIEAHDRYEDAVESSGKGSREAAKAAADYQQKLESLPPATREAAVAVGLLRDAYQDWSDDLSDDVMAPVIKGVAVANSLLPKTTGLVRAASGQFDRLITLVGGAISTPGFDALNDRFTAFTERTLTRGIDKLTIFLARAQAGELDNSRLNRWMDYAREVGPEVWDTLENIGDALINVLEAGSDIGVGALDVVNFLTGVVSAVPPEAIATLLQLAIAIKAVRLAAAGAGAAKAAMLALGTQIMAMRTAAAGAPGALAGVGAAVSGLSRTAKLAMAGTGIGLLLIGLDAIASKSEKPKPDVDKLSTSLVELARSGKVSGEVLRAYGQDLSGLGEAFQLAIDPKGIDQFQQSLVSVIGMDSTPVKNAKEDIGALDDALAGLVSSGKADLAAAVLDRVIANLEKQGFTSDQVRGQLDDYKAALAGQALEAELAAESMGLFGDQAIAVQEKLNAQKASADGLRQSIIALNEVNRSALDAQAAFEGSLDNAAKSAREYGNVWKANGGKLDLTTEKGRNAYRALSDLAGKTNEATAAAREAKAPWSEVSSTFDRGRRELIKNAEQMGLTTTEAKRLADQILDIPDDKTTQLKGNIEDLQEKLGKAKGELKRVPDSRKAKVRAEIDDLKRKIKQAEYELSRLQDKTVTVTTRFVVVGDGSAARRAGSHGSQLRNAQGGPIGRFAGGGDVQLIPFGGPVWGPGTSMSDSVPAWLSNGEYVIRASAVERYGISLFDALNSERFAGGGFAGGGFTYTPSQSAAARISTSTVSSWYDQDMQRLRDAWAKLNEALRAQAKHSTSATRKAVADARKAVNEADRALGLKPGTKPSGFSLTGYGQNLKEAVRASDAWEKNLSRIGKRAGADIEETLRGMGESGRALVASLAKASNKQFAEIVKNLRKLAPTAAATLADYTKQLTATTAGSKKFQDNLLKLAASGYGDLAMQLAGQGDADAMAIAAAAVKSPAAAKKANTALQAHEKLLSADELAAAAQMMGALSKKGATVEDVVKAGVSWPMLAHLAPRYAKEIKALAGGPSFVKGMKERGIALAQGGLLLGPGTATSDSIPLWGSNGEYMVKAAAVAKYGIKFMDALNDGKLPVGRAARPGLPAAPVAAAPAAGSDRPPVNYYVYPRKSVIDVEDLRLLQRQEEARQRVGRPG